MNQTEIQQIGDELYFITGSPASRRLRTQAELLAQTDVSLLISGERGSGKSTAARLIHSLSIRSGFPFISVNCTALTADLQESELFGYEHVNGSGRLECKPGKIEQCGKGTILLQDFDAMPMLMQGRLLKLLQTREFVRFGGHSLVRAEARIITATGCDLRQAVAEGKIDEGLYTHLSAFRLDVPPLRERADEMPLLLGHFMNRLSRHYGLPSPSFSTALLEAARHYSWPGNLRQLEVFVKRFLVLGDEAAALEELNSQPSADVDKGNGDANGHGKAADPHGGEKSSLKSLVRHAKGETERNAIAQALEESHWNRKAAARALSISYRALLYKIDEYHLFPQHSLAIRSQRFEEGNESNEASKETAHDRKH